MHTRSRLGQTGLSLVELIIAMAISLTLVAGLYRVFISSTVTYREQDTLARLQENVRTVMDVLAREVRMGGSPRFTIDGAAFNTGAACTVNADFDTAGADIYAPVTIIQGVGANSSDTVTVRYKDTAAAACTQVRFSVDPATFVLQQNTQVGAAAATGEQAVVDGVENLQAVYGLDTNGDGSVDSYTTVAGAIPIVVRIRLLMRTDAQAGEADLDTACYDVDGDVATSAPAPCLAGQEFDPVDDRRTRRIFTTTLTLRNQLQ